MGAKLVDQALRAQAGLLRLDKDEDKELKEKIKINLRIVDEQDAVRRYKWVNLPDGLETIIERVLYYKGQGMFFYLESTGKFYFLPYTMADKDDIYGIDIYGRFNCVRPLPFNGTTSDKEDKDKAKKDSIRYAYLMDKKFIPQYNMVLEEINDPEFLNTSCVLLTDYSKQQSETVIPRQKMIDPILDVMSNCIPFMNTSLQINTGITGMRVNNQDEVQNVLNANRNLKKAALTGEAYMPIEGAVDFQPLKESSPATSQEFMQAMESLDNFRLGLYGISNGGIFAKKAHMLQTEQDMAGGAVGLVYQDGLTLRQEFCAIVNSIWALGIGCEASEPEIGDENMDGFQVDEGDQFIESDGAVEGGEESNE